jgi:thioredoxin-like negative regulator of GroEL
VTNLSLAVLLQLSMAASDGDAYAKAYRDTARTGRPMVVLVSAEWCPACQQMKRDVIPRIKRQGLLSKVAFAMVNLDRDRELGRQLIRGGPIPQLLFFRRTPNGWLRSRLIGGQSVRTVEQFINTGLRRDQATKQVEWPAAGSTR